MYSNNNGLFQILLKSISLFTSLILQPYNTRTIALAMLKIPLAGRDLWQIPACCNFSNYINNLCKWTVASSSLQTASMSLIPRVILICSAFIGLYQNTFRVTKLLLIPSVNNHLTLLLPFSNIFLLSTQKNVEHILFHWIRYTMYMPFTKLYYKNKVVQWHHTSLGKL